MPGLGRVLVEVKARKRVALEAWLEGRGLLVLKGDRRPPLAVLPLEALLALIRAANGEALTSNPHPLPRGRNELYNPHSFPGNGGCEMASTAPPSTRWQRQSPSPPGLANRNRPRLSWT